MEHIRRPSAEAERWDEPAHLPLALPAPRWHGPAATPGPAVNQITGSMSCASSKDNKPL